MNSLDLSKYELKGEISKKRNSIVENQNSNSYLNIGKNEEANPIVKQFKVDRAQSEIKKYLDLQLQQK